jgi:hypothetical protein
VVRVRLDRKATAITLLVVVGVQIPRHAAPAFRNDAAP